jgi:hypothetical protein
MITYFSCQDARRIRGFHRGEGSQDCHRVAIGTVHLWRMLRSNGITSNGRVSVRKQASPERASVWPRTLSIAWLASLHLIGNFEPAIMAEEMPSDKALA